MALDIKTVASRPQDYQFLITSKTGEKFRFRPLEKTDEAELANLLDSLSEKTKMFVSHTKPGSAIAREHCQAINKYDKLRFVLEKADRSALVGLFEFSFSIPQGDLDRFEKYGIKLSEETDCRMGPLLQDNYQSQGIASAVLPVLIDIAAKFAKKRIILWGGVMQENIQAVRFYEKNGFKNVGSFVDESKDLDPDYCLDMILEISN